MDLIHATLLPNAPTLSAVTTAPVQLVSPATASPVATLTSVKTTSTLVEPTPSASTSKAVMIALAPLDSLKTAFLAKSQIDARQILVHLEPSARINTERSSALVRMDSSRALASDASTSMSAPRDSQDATSTRFASTTRAASNANARNG